MSDNARTRVNKRKMLNEISCVVPQLPIGPAKLPEICRGFFKPVDPQKHPPQGFPKQLRILPISGTQFKKTETNLREQALELKEVLKSAVDKGYVVITTPSKT
jgi:hypothetical protein